MIDFEANVAFDSWARIVDLFVDMLPCTTNKRGQIIERSIYQEAIEANKKRVDENPEYYKLRQQITEHQFGTLKRQWELQNSI